MVQQMPQQNLTQQPGLTEDQPVIDQQETDGVGEPGFTIDANQIEDTIKEHIDPKQISALDRVVKAGHELMFGKDTHNKIMDGLEGSQDIGGDLGSGAANMMMLLFKQSGNTIPGDVIIPAGVILLARAGEFFNESGIPITDDDFEEAVHTFTTLTIDKLDPGRFSGRGKGEGEGEGYNGAKEQQGQQEIPQQAIPGNGGGLLNSAGG